MSGFLTGVFDDGSHSADNAQHVGAQDEAGIDQSFTVTDAESLQFEDMNGTTHSYSNSQDVTVDVGTHAMLAVAVDTAQGAFNGDGFEE